LEPGEVWTFTASHTVVQDDLERGFYTNDATASGTPAGGDLEDAEAQETVDAVRLPGISLVKSGTFADENEDGFAQAGETVTYAFTVTNTGNVALTGVTVSDPLVTVTGGPVDLAAGAFDE